MPLCYHFTSAVKDNLNSNEQRYMEGEGVTSKGVVKTLQRGGETGSLAEEGSQEHLGPLQEPLVKALEVVLGLAVTGELVLLFGSTISRTFFNYSITWALEIAEICLAVMAFIGGAVGYARSKHTRVVIGVTITPKAIQPYLILVAEWCVCLISAACFAESLDTLKQEWIQYTPVLHMRVFWNALPLTLGMFFLTLFSLIRIAKANLRQAAVTGVIVLFLLGLAVWLPEMQPTQSLLLSMIVLLFLLFAGVPIAFALLVGAELILLLGDGYAAVTQVPIAMEAGTSTYILLSIPFFVLAGGLMTLGGVTKPLIDFADSLVGRFRGGLLHVMLISMYVFSGISGSKLADVSAVGGTMRGPLKERGYEPAESAAVLSSAAVMGETVPPSLAMIVLGSVTTLSISSLFLAGLLPAVVIGLCLMAYIVWKHPREEHTGEGNRHRIALGVRALPALVVPIVLVGGILSGLATATEASAYAVVCAILIGGLVYRALRPATLWRTLVDSATLGGIILFIIGAASPFARALTLVDVPQWVVTELSGLGTNKWTLVVSTVFIMLIMGQLLEGLPALLIFGPLLMPLAPQFGIEPLNFAMIFLMSLGLGSFSPPVGVGLYVAAGVLEASVEETAMRLIPYGAVKLVGIFIIAWIPWLSLGLPSLL